MKKAIVYGTGTGLTISGNPQEVLRVLREFSIKTYLLMFTGAFLLTGLVAAVALNRIANP